MADVPLPEPAAWQVRRNDYGLWESTYFEECSEWEAKNCVAAADLRQLYTADQMRSYAAAVTAAKDAEIAALQAEVAGLREELEAARQVMRSVRVFVTGREKIKHPEGTEWFDSAVTAIDAALAARKGEA